MPPSGMKILTPLPRPWNNRVLGRMGPINVNLIYIKRYRTRIILDSIDAKGGVKITRDAVQCYAAAQKIADRQNLIFSCRGRTFPALDISR